jgi:hypothetical protein
MALLIVNATGSPLFGDFLMLVSVTLADGRPVKNLKPGNFNVHHLASLNHASVKARSTAKATEGPDGFYTLQLSPDKVQPTLPHGHYVFAVGVNGLARAGAAPAHGQTVAVGDLPPP